MQVMAIAALIHLHLIRNPFQVLQPDRGTKHTHIHTHIFTLFLSLKGYVGVLCLQHTAWLVLNTDVFVAGLTLALLLKV